MDQAHDRAGVATQSLRGPIRGAPEGRTNRGLFAIRSAHRSENKKSRKRLRGSGFFYSYGLKNYRSSGPLGLLSVDDQTFVGADELPGADVSHGSLRSLSAEGFAGVCGAAAVAAGLDVAAWA